MFGEKILIDYLQIVASKNNSQDSMNMPYYSLIYHEVNNNDCHIGFSSYSLPIVLAYILDYFIFKW